MRTTVVAVAVVALLSSTAAARTAHDEHRDLGLMLIVLGGLATAAGTITAFVWEQAFWSNFGCEVGNALGGEQTSCGDVDPALIPTGAALVGVGQAAVIAGSVLLRF